MSEKMLSITVQIPVDTNLSDEKINTMCEEVIPALFLKFINETLPADIFKGQSYYEERRDPVDDFLYWGIEGGIDNN